MSWNQIIYWMAHVGEGTWAGFKRAVTSIAPEGSDTKEVARALRMRFSDLAFGEFFLERSERWRAFVPLLVSSPHDSHHALLAGVRTPGLVDKLRAGADAANCKLFEIVVEGQFTNVKIHGSALRRVAAAAGIGFEPDIGRRLGVQLVTLEDAMRNAPRRVPPRDWSPSSFNLAEMNWVEGVENGRALQFTSKYSERAYFVRAEGGDLVELPKRLAIFAAAAMDDVRLAVYDSRSREFSVPVAAPLPEPCARAACLAGGRASVVRARRILYENVPARLAAIIVANLGQPAGDLRPCAQP
jgi:hypothetical protein